MKKCVKIYNIRLEKCVEGKPIEEKTQQVLVRHVVDDRIASYPDFVKNMNDNEEEFRKKFK